ncbi:MAG TPA: hypothetical protein DCP31_11270 [Cyanobacteria bacterium UBA8543]|nr:hypothetical protein [Cyanobacteria bacterium UBA8543]
MIRVYSYQKHGMGREYAKSSDLISRHTPEGIFLYASPVCRTLLGYEPDELVGRSACEFCHPQDLAALSQSHSNIVNFLEMNTVSYRIRRQDGNYIWFESTTTSIYHPETGVVEEIVAVSRDITTQKQAEAELLEQRCTAHTALIRLSNLAANIGAILAKGGRLAVMLQDCTEAIVQQLHLTSAAIWTLNPASAQLEQQASSGQVISLNPDVINLVTQTRQPYLSSESQQELNSSLLPEHFSGYPLVVEDQIIGVMALLSSQSLAQETHSILSGMASAIAVAIDRCWARSESVCRRESLLFDLTVELRNSLEVDTILETAVQSIRNALQIDQCQFLWYRSHQGVPYWEVVKEARNPLLSSASESAIANVESFTTRLLNRQTIQVDDVETLIEPSLRQFLLTQGYTSLLSIPIETQSGKIGVINCAQCTKTRHWNPSEVELLQALVAQVAIAINQAELYTQQQQAAQKAQEKAQQLELTLHQLQATQAQLLQTERMSSLGHLVAGVAHEINNPVNFIHNNLSYASAYFYDILSLLRLYEEYYPNVPEAIAEQAELVNIDFIAKDLPKLLTSMQRGSDRIRAIVLSLQNFSRVNEDEMKPVDLHEGIDNTLLILQHRLQAKGQQPEIQVLKEYGELPLVECYPGQLNQAFMNILSNAIEALTLSEAESPQHLSPAITIRTSILDSSDPTQNSLYPPTEQYCATTGNSRSVVIQIADNGPGITEAVQARLFDPFFTTKPVGHGTGLGLSISYQIVVEKHNGVLTCTSLPGQGTAFWIVIPIQQNNG